MAKTRSKLTPARQTYLNSLKVVPTYGAVNSLASGVVADSTVNVLKNEDEPHRDVILVHNLTEADFNSVRFNGYLPHEYIAEKSLGVYRKKLATHLGKLKLRTKGNAMTDEILAEIDATYEPYVSVAQQTLAEHVEQHGPNAAYNPEAYADRFIEPATDMINSLMRVYLKYQVSLTIAQFYQAVSMRIAKWAAERFWQVAVAFNKDVRVAKLFV